MKSSLPLLASLSAAAALMSGCTFGARVPVNTTKYDLENHDPFVLLGARVQRSVTCSGIQKRVQPDGRLEVVANVRNREDRRVEVQINCEFKDGHGSVIDAGPFQSLILSPLAQEAVRFIAMGPNASAFTIRVREVQ